MSAQCNNMGFCSFEVKNTQFTRLWSPVYTCTQVSDVNVSLCGNVRSLCLTVSWYAHFRFPFEFRLFIYAVYLWHLAICFCRMSCRSMCIYDLWNWMLIYNTMNTFQCIIKAAFNNRYDSCNLVHDLHGILCKQIEYCLRPTRGTTRHHFHCTWTIHWCFFCSRSKGKLVYHTDLSIQPIFSRIKWM